MAALQMQHTSNFDVPATEDLMELTSDMDRRLGTDEGIDLDIDITGGNQYDGEDEYMEEDLDEPVAQSLPNEQDIREGSDDGMAEDSYAASIAEQASMVDEDIDDADYTGPDVDEDTIVDTALENVADSNQNLDSQDQTSGTLDLAHAVHTQQTTADGDFTFIAESLPGGQQGISAINYDISGLATQHLSQEQSKQINIRESSGHDQAQHSGDKVLVAAKSEPEQLESNRDTPTLSTAKIVGPADVEEVKYKQPEGNDEPAVSSEEDATAPSTLEEAQIKDHSTAEDDFSSRALHPVIVGYQNNEISLFPLVPQDEEHSETYFLRDECHADEFVRDLLDALRSVLEDSINEHDELMISIDDLGLDISEVSPPSCLSQYLLLTYYSLFPSVLLRPSDNSSTYISTCNSTTGWTPFRHFTYT